MSDNCPNCKGSIWMLKEKEKVIYCFYCGFIDSEENRQKLEEMKNENNREEL